MRVCVRRRRGFFIVKRVLKVYVCMPKKGIMCTRYFASLLGVRREHSPFTLRSSRYDTVILQTDRR